VWGYFYLSFEYFIFFFFLENYVEKLYISFNLLKIILFGKKKTNTVENVLCFFYYYPNSLLLELPGNEVLASFI